MVWYEVILRLGLAIIVGGLIGYEREFKHRPAGFRTHILVCIGAAVTSMIQLYAIQETSAMILSHPTLASALKADIGRLGAQVITGVGFLGAGTIIHDKGSVKGLTTAASIWVVACIGLAVGLGYYFLSIFSTLGAYIVLVSLKQVESRFIEKGKLIKLEVTYINRTNLINRLDEYFSSRKVIVKSIDFGTEDDEDTESNISWFTVLIPHKMSSAELIKDLSSNEDIIRISIK